MSEELEADWLEYSAPDGYSPEATGEPWKPRTEAEASWVAEQAVRVHSRLQQVRSMAEEKKRKLQDWLDKHEKKLQPELNHWEEKAVTWFQEHRQQLLDSGVPESKLPKTIAFDSGAQLTARVSQGSTIIHDSNQAVKYLYQNGYRDMVKVTREPIKGEVKKHVRSTGELIPGIEVEEPGINLKLKLD